MSLIVLFLMGAGNAAYAPDALLRVTFVFLFNMEFIQLCRRQVAVGAGGPRSDYSTRRGGGDEQREAVRMRQARSLPFHIIIQVPMLLY